MMSDPPYLVSHDYHVQRLDMVDAELNGLNGQRVPEPIAHHGEQQQSQQQSQQQQQQQEQHLQENILWFSLVTILWFLLVTCAQGQHTQEQSQGQKLQQQHMQQQHTPRNNRVDRPETRLTQQNLEYLKENKNSAEHSDQQHPIAQPCLPTWTLCTRPTSYSHEHILHGQQEEKSCTELFLRCRIHCLSYITPGYIMLHCFPQQGGQSFPPEDKGQHHTHQQNTGQPQPLPPQDKGQPDPHQQKTEQPLPPQNKEQPFTAEDKGQPHHHQQNDIKQDLGNDERFELSTKSLLYGQW